MNLSPRELQVLRLLAEGMTGKRVAQALAISPETVKGYTDKARIKLQSATNTQAVFKAARQGLI